MPERPVLIAAAPRDPFVSAVIRLLRTEGRSVLVSHSCEAAFRAARAKQPAIIVLDALLPEGDGLSLCRRIKADPGTSHIPVFCFSVLMSRDRCLEAGAEGFMLKPVEQDLLLERVREILDSPIRRFPQQPPARSPKTANTSSGPKAGSQG